MSHRKSSPAGAGRQAGQGLKAIARAEYEACIKSVPKMKFDYRGIAVMIEPTDQQRKGLRYLAQKPDMKLKAETGEDHDVWELVDHGDRIEVIHLRYNAKHQEVQASRDRIAKIGRLSFHRGLADFHPQTDDEEQGLLELIAEQNRLAAKYDGRSEWSYTKADDGRYFITKRQPQAAS